MAFSRKMAKGVTVKVEVGKKLKTWCNTLTADTVSVLEKRIPTS